MMRAFFKGLGLFVAIACVVWVAVLWQWQSSRHDMSSEDIVLYLGVLPLVLFGAALLARWAWSAASARADRRANAQTLAPSSSALPAEAAAARDAARHATCQLLAAPVNCAAAASARDLLQAARKGRPRPGLDRTLRRADGLPAITARAAAADEAELDASISPVLDFVRRQKPEYAGQTPDDRLLRAFGLLRPVLAEALAAMSPWSALLGGSHEDDDAPASVGAAAGADTLAQVAAHGALRQAASATEPAAVRVLVAWPEGTADFSLALAQRWLVGTLRELGEGMVAPERWRLHHHPAGSGPELLLEADRLQHAQRREGRGDLLLIAACHSDLDPLTVLRLDDAQALFGSAAPRGRIPGEAAAALLLADAAWPADPSADRPPPHLHRPAVGQRGKSIDAPGRTSSEVAVQLLQQALAAAGLPAAEAPALASDADQHTPRGPELFGATLTELPHLDAAEDLHLAGPVCGHLGPCGALASVAMAAQHAVDTGQPCLALSVGDPVWRAALLARPEVPAPQGAFRTDPTAA